MQKGNAIAANIRQHRARIGLTQAKLAEQIGQTQRLISKWEVGEADPRISQLALLARALGCGIADLIMGYEPPDEGAPIGTPGRPRTRRTAPARRRAVPPPNPLKPRSGPAALPKRGRSSKTATPPTAA